MSKTELLPEINIGAIGHVDHGKTTLTYALTGKWTMVHSEELKRGITIKLGYADASIYYCKKCNIYSPEEKCNCGGKAELVRKVSFVDAPGHETLMAVMISGAAIMDGALLVIAANEVCPQPQTKEHLMALKILGLKNVIIVQNKVDLVTKAKAIENYKAIKQFAKEMLGFDVPIIPISAQKKVNIDVLLEAMQEYFPTPKRDLSKDPILMVARSFDINKPGSNMDNLIGGVIGGSIAQGLFKQGDELEIKPGLRIEKKGGTVEWKVVKAKINTIVCGSTTVKEKGPGGTVAFSTTLDPAVSKGDSFVGNLAGKIGKLPKIYETLTIEAHLFDYVVGTKENIKIDPIKQYEPLMLSVGGATTLGITQSAGKKMVLTLRKPVCASKDDKVAIVRQVKNRWHLIGYGLVV